MSGGPGHDERDPNASPPAPRPPASARPLHLRPGLIALVVLGGAAGTLARYGGESLVPRAGELPWPTLAVNVVGAFALGLFLEGLARRGRDEGIRRLLRVAVGTGFFGAFTTYSSLADDATLLLHSGRVPEAVAYALVSIVVGVVVSALGVAAAARYHRRRQARGEATP